MIRKLFLIFVCMSLLLCGCASAYATYSSSLNQIQVWNEPEVNFTYLYELLSTGPHNENDVLLSRDGNIWYLNATIRQYGTEVRNFYINDSDVSELRIRGASAGIDLYAGSWHIENVTIGSWDYNTNSYSIDDGVALIEGHIPKLRNVNFTHFGRVYSLNSNGVEYYNITYMNGAGAALLLSKFNNSVIRDVYINGYGTTGLSLAASFDSEAYNITVINDGCPQERTGHYGIVVEYDGAGVRSENVTVHDCYVRRTGWSGVDTNSYNNTFYNITIEEGGHNGLDIHGGYNTTVNNVSIHNSSGNNLYAIGENSTYTDIYSYSPGAGGGGDHINIYRDNSTFKNITMVGGQRGITMFGANNTLLMNLTKINSTGRPIVLTAVDGYSEPKNTTFIDADFSSGPIYFANCANTKMINVKYDQYLGGTTAPSERIFYYYPDVIILDSDGNLTRDTIIQFTNDVNNSKFPCIDAYGNEKDLFITDFNGRLPSPMNDRTNSPVIAESYRDFGEYIQFNHTIDVTLPNEHIFSLSGITPDSSWYRPDPNIPTYTITAIIPDNSTGLHITGFAPSVEENTFSAGDEVTYQVWLSEDADSISWEKNGVEVATDTLTYRDTFSTDPVVMSFSATDANGDVSYTWDYNPEALPVAEFSANVTSGTVPLSVQFTDLSENALSWYWDFDNDGTVDNSTQNPEYIYSTAGTYTVNLTVQNGENTDSEVKELYISVESPSIITSYWNSFWAWWGMRWQVTYWLQEAV